MPRRMRPAPPNINLMKTTRGTWIAVEEIWDTDGRLLELRPMRSRDDDCILQADERRDMLEAVEQVILRRELEDARRELAQLRKRGASDTRDTAARYSNPRSSASSSATSSDAVARVS